MDIAQNWMYTCHKEFIYIKICAFNLLILYVQEVYIHFILYLIYKLDHDFLDIQHMLKYLDQR